MKLVDPIIKLLIGLAVAYLGLLAFGYFYTYPMMYPGGGADYEDTRETFLIQLSGGESIPVWYKPHPDASHTIIYSHGNGETLGSSQDRLQPFYDRGYSVIAYEYPGYGSATGTPTQHNVSEALERIYADLVKEGVDPKTIILYGYSIGSGQTVQLAMEKPVAGIVLEGAFESVFRVPWYARFLPWDVFPNKERLADVHVPVLLYHGKLDQVVQFYHGESLYEAANEPKMHVWFDAGTHGNLQTIEPERYWGGFDAFVKMLK